MAHCFTDWVTEAPWETGRASFCSDVTAHMQTAGYQRDLTLNPGTQHLPGMQHSKTCEYSCKSCTLVMTRSTLIHTFVDWIMFI